jgi:hypothetical protein
MRLSFDRLWVLLAVALPALVSLIAPLPAVDLAYQVRSGELILTTGAIPATDTFTFTAFGNPWTDQQWLAQVLLALGYRAGGWELLAVARAAMVALTFALVLGTAVARGSSLRTAAVLSLLAFLVTAPALALRPQLLGIAIFAALTWLVAERHRHPRWLWLAPLLIVVWANVHGSVVLAPALLGYAWLDDLVAGRAHRSSLAVLVMGAIATLVNPFGVGVWGYALGVGTNPEITSRVAEWQRTTPLTVPGLLFYGSAVAVAAVVWLRRQLVRWPDLLWLAALFALGVWTVRGVAWWPAGSVLVVAGLLPAGEPVRRPGPNPLNAVVAAVVGLALVVALPWWRAPDPLTGRVGLLSYAPSGLAAALRSAARPGDHVFVPQTLGSWFEWAVPDTLVFVDSRIELFSRGVWDDYDAVAMGQLEAASERWSLALIVTPPGESLSARGWSLLYADEDGSLYGRVLSMRVAGLLAGSGASPDSGRNREANLRP